MSATVDTSLAKRRPPALGRTVSRVALAVLLIVCLLAPAIFSGFWLNQILTRALWLGIAALSLTFLSSYGGMVSLAQVGVYAVAGFMMANLGTGNGGLSLGWPPWVAAIAGVGIGTLVALMFGAVSCRSYGIYFLMLTLALSILVFYFFLQVSQLSGYGGVRNVETPAVIGNPILHPNGLYYISLAAAILCFAGIWYLGGAAFGMVMKGIRDDPDRMRALGYYVPLHRMIAFGVAGFVASIAGILSVWFNTGISPGSVDIDQVITVLIIAVIGGLYRLEGAFLGALVYSILDNYSRDWTPHVGSFLGPGRFATELGIIFLVIVLVSPGGLMGIYESVRARLVKAPEGGATGGADPVGPAAAEQQQRAGARQQPPTQEQPPTQTSPARGGTQ